MVCVCVFMCVCMLYLRCCRFVITTVAAVVAAVAPPPPMLLLVSFFGYFALLLLPLLLLLPGLNGRTIRDPGVLRAWCVPPVHVLPPGAAPMSHWGGAVCKSFGPTADYSSSSSSSILHMGLAEWVNTPPEFGRGGPMKSP